MSQSSCEPRFHHLLQPIRDLTKNWDVDIASQLEEYLGEIEQISITFDGGATTMNFAEAALLIQGSACVYSKKVEYLCSLVYEVLDSLASRTKLATAASVDTEGNDKDVSANANATASEHFLTLNDIDEKKNLRTKDSDDHRETSVVILLKTPLALVPLEETEKGDNPLVSRPGEVLASQSDFNMNTCCPHHSGEVLLLDSSHLSLFALSLRRRPTSTPATASRFGAAVDDGIAMETDPTEDEGLPLQDMSMADHDVSCDEPLAASREVGRTACDVAQSERDCLRRSTRNKTAPLMPVKPFVDPWLPLDQHDAKAVTAKPCRKGRVFKLPKSVRKERSLKRKRSEPSVVDVDAEQKLKVGIALFCQKAFYSHDSKYPHNALKVPSLPEFEQLFLKELKRRQALQKLDRRRMFLHGRFDELAEQEAAEEDDYAEAPSLVDGGDDDGADDVGDLLIPDLIDLRAVHEEALSTMSEGNSYEDLVKKYVDGFLASAQQYAQTTELSRRVADWEQKILPQLAEEEMRVPFDIHQYGSMILAALKSRDATGGGWVAFRDIAADRPDFEVCRLLLASLQLANNDNVDIESIGVLEKSINSMSLRLLSTSRHHEKLEDYMAPSSQVSRPSPRVSRPSSQR